MLYFSEFQGKTQGQGGVGEKKLQSVTRVDRAEKEQFALKQVNK